MGARRIVVSFVVAAVTGFFGVGCQDERTPRPVFECTTTREAHDTDEANDLLEDAEPGTCVVLKSESAFVGPFVVPPGVALVQGGLTPIVGSSTSNGPTVVLSEGSRASRLTIQRAPGIGIEVRAASAQLEFVTVKQSARAAIAVTCDPAAAPCHDGTIVLSRVSAMENGAGLWISGAHVFLDSSSVGDTTGTYPGGGTGLVARNGARVDAIESFVTRSAGTGILIDGERTKATFRRSGASGNGEYGLFVQGVRGTVDQPAVALSDFSIRQSAIGFGAFDSSGVVMIKGHASDQSLRNGTYGVGIVLSGESSDLLFDRCALAAYGSSSRPAVIIHDATRGRIEFLNAPGDPGARPKVVVQGAIGAQLALQELDVMTTAAPLPVRSERLAVPEQP